MTDASFICASWNIHRGRGGDGRTDPDRIARALIDDICAPGLDALVLQEADEAPAPHRGFLNLAAVCAGIGLHHIHADPAKRWGADSHGFLGVVLFVHPRWTVQDITLLDLPGHYHRGAVVADLVADGQSLRLIGTHLSLSQGLRVVQMRIIGQHLARRSPRQTLLCGDLNEWRPWGGLALSARVSGVGFAGPAPMTFPVGRPILPLDRVLATLPARVMHTRVLDSPTIRAASDHRPIRAEVALGRA